MNASEVTYGCEIECYVPVGTIRNIGGYHRGVQVRNLPAGWNAQRDCSLTSAPDGYVAVEIVSPILRGCEGLRQIVQVCEWLNGHHARVNASCGFHVHVGAERNVSLLKKIACLVARHEKAFYAATGAKERERNRYCRSIQQFCEYRNEIQNGDMNRYGAVSRSRYCVLNMVNVLDCSRSAVEFRVFAGTTNPTKIVSYIRMCLAIVEKAHDVKLLPKWESRRLKETSRLVCKNGSGSTELNRFFKNFAWVPCKLRRRRGAYGNLFSEGVPTLEESKKELMKQAAKYDAC